MILMVLSSLVLLFHLTKGVIYLFKGVVNFITPLFSKRERIKKTPQYKAFCKNIDKGFSNPPSKKQYS
jgi:hypothetical protein